jgi:transcription termination factor Rho
VDTINGTPADQVAEGTRYEDLPAAFPEERLALGSEDLTVRAIEWLTPFGRGSRVAIVGAARAGKTEALLRLAAALAAGAEGDGGYELTVVLAGVRPEEIGAWQAGPVQPSTAVSFAASTDSQAQAIEGSVEQARRRAARGAHVVLLIDTLDALSPSAARRALGAARRIVDGGSLTIVGTARAPVGGETTVIALDETLASARRYPALDLRASGVLRPELLVGDAGAEAIATARAEAAG